MRIRIAALLVAACACLLGSVPATADPTDILDWRPVLTDQPRAQEEKLDSAEPKTVPDVLRLEAACGGGNRVFWRVTFARQFDSSDVLLILYLDVDGDESTGRTGYPVQGTDRMLTLANGEIGSYMHGSAGEGKRTRAYIEGSSVVFRDDLGLLAARIRDTLSGAGSAFDFTFRARVLCHRISDSKDADDTAWASASLRIDPKMPRPHDEEAGAEPLLQDLVVSRNASGALEIRFTTPEAMFAGVRGDGAAVCRYGAGMSRNHAWSLSGVPAEGDVKYAITLRDDLGQEFTRYDLTYHAEAHEKMTQSSRIHRVSVFLNADTLSLAERVRSMPDVRWPVAGGIPFPESALYSPECVRLLDDRGEERPAQVDALSRWPDGSIRWLLVEFIAQLPRDISRRFVVEYGAKVRRRDPDDGGLAAVDVAGLWRERLTWKDSGPVGRIPSGPAALERDGPIHRVYLTDGRYGGDGDDSPFGWQARVHVYRDFPLVRIEHTLKVQDGDPMARLGSLRLVLPAAAGAAQDTANKVRVCALSHPADHAGTPDGFVVSRNGGGVAFVAVRNCAENWPKELIDDGDSLFVDLFPALDAGQYSDRPEPEEMLYYCFEDGYYKLRRGVNKTHEILYGVFPAGAPMPDAETLAYWFDNPPVLRADAAWVCSSGAAGPLEPKTQQAFPQYEERVRELFDRVEARRRRQHEYGFLNFGDWYGERGRNWGNLEYDLGHALWLEWLRSGDYRYFRRAQQAVAHMGDVDVVHADPEPMSIGRAWTHAMGHTGGYYPDGAFGMEQFCTRGYWDNGHVWTEGMLHLYLATGSRRFFDDGMLVARQLAESATVDFRMGTERTAGWPIMALVAAYETTADAYFLNAAKIIARVVVDKQDPVRGGWFHKIGECRHDPPHYGGKPFMTGVLTTALSRLHRLLPDQTPEDQQFRDQVKDSLLRGCDWLLEEAWQPEVNGFFYAQCPTFYGRACTAAPWMTCEALAYASEVSGDPRYVDTAVKAMQEVLKTPTSDLGKALAMQLRSTPHFLAQLARRSSR